MAYQKVFSKKKVFWNAKQLGLFKVQVVVPVLLGEKYFIYVIFGTVSIRVNCTRLIYESIIDDDICIYIFVIELYSICRAFRVLYSDSNDPTIFITLFILSANVYFSPLRLKSHLSIIKIALR